MEAKPEKELLTQIVALLDGVVSGSIEAEKAVKQWRELGSVVTLAPKAKKLVSEAWEDLYHFMDDEDIPIRDPKYGPKYRERQREQIANRARELTQLLAE